MEELIVDPEIQSKIPALTDDEFKQLEANILEEGQILMPIICWNDVIIDGHNRYKIAQEHPGIPFQVKRIDFENKYEAIVWMCHNQLGRRNITPESRKILIGTAYEAQMMAHGGERHTQRDEGGKFTASGEFQHLRSDRHCTRKAVANEFETSIWDVHNSTDITRGVNAAEEISPGFKNAYVSGAIKSPDYTVKEIPKVPDNARPLLVEAIEAGNNKKAREIIKATIPKEKQKSEKPAKPFFEEPDGKFDVEDFSKELQIIVESMDDDFNRYFVREYADMLAQEDGRKAAYDALEKGRKVIETYTEVVDSYNE